MTTQILVQIQRTQMLILEHLKLNIKPSPDSSAPLLTHMSFPPMHTTLTTQSAPACGLATTPTQSIPDGIPHITSTPEQPGCSYGQEEINVDTDVDYQTAVGLAMDVQNVYIDNINIDDQDLSDVWESLSSFPPSPEQSLPVTPSPLPKPFLPTRLYPDTAQNSSFSQPYQASPPTTMSFHQQTPPTTYMMVPTSFSIQPQPLPHSASFSAQPIQLQQSMPHQPQPLQQSMQSPPIP